MSKIIARTGTVWMSCLLASVLSAAVAGAGPLYWDWPRGESFAGALLDGAALDDGGRLCAGLGATPLVTGGPEVHWCIVADGDGGFFTGTGHAGEIHHIDASGRSRLVAQTAAAEVFALLPSADGGLLAGCGPEGALLRVADDGAIAEIGRVPGGYVWALLAGPDGTVWAATGSPAAVWKLEPGGAFVPVVDLPAQNVLDLAWDGQGRLLAATQGPGLVYSIDPVHPDRPRLLAQTDQAEARRFVAGPGGAMFVLALESGDDEGDGSSPRQGGANGNGNHGGMFSMRDFMADDGPAPAALYRVADDGTVEPYWSGDQDLMIAAWTEADGWLGGAVRDEDRQRAVVYRLTPPAGMQPVAGWDGGDVMALLPDPARGRIVACEAHPGGVTALSAAAGVVRSATSRPVDAGRSTAWGRLRWSGDDRGGRVQWYARSGNRAEPDADWSPWRGPWSGRDEALDVPAGRFLQWRAVFPDGAPVGACPVDEVSVSAWRGNLPPAITAFAAEQLNALLAGGLMPRGENVTQAFASGLRVEFSRTANGSFGSAEERDAAFRAVRSFSWDAEDPDGDRIVFDLEYRRAGDQAWRPILEGTHETVGAWDTGELPDGRYELRLTASDAPDNPAAQAGRTVRLLGPLAVDNTPPVLERVAAERAPQGVRLRLRAEDAGGVLAGAEVILPDGSRERLDPVDRICDSSREDFDAVIVWPRARQGAQDPPWPLRIEVRDLGGNVGHADLEIAR